MIYNLNKIMLEIKMLMLSSKEIKLKGMFLRGKLIKMGRFISINKRRRNQGGGLLLAFWG